MDRLFGTNGVRGIFEQDLTLDFVTDLTLSIATYFGRGPILVGYDGRNSSPIIARTVCSTLNYAGLDCKDAGLVPTPCLEFAVKKLGYNGGIMITASHNPPEYNGIKPVASDGVEISREDELVIEQIFFQKDWNKSPTQGRTGTENGSIQTYLDGIKSQIDCDKIRSKQLQVVIDAGNGAQAVTAPALCDELGCKVTVLNQKIDGKFPGRGSEPTPENLSDLSAKVKEENADIGVAFDGDGDRSLFCDEKGCILTGDKSALLLSDYLLQKEPGSEVVTCLNSGSGIEHIAQKHQSKVTRTKVGSVEVSRAMVPRGALVGFEENGGFMFGPHNYVRDGAMTLALMLDILAKKDNCLSSIVEKLPNSFTSKTKVECSKDQARGLIQVLQSEYPCADTRDGIKIVFDERNWIMIRPSGTEPIVRIYGESESQQKLDTLMDEFVSKVRAIVSR